MPLPVVSHRGYEFDIGAHVFPTAKYRLVRERLLAEGTIVPADVVEPEPVTDADVLLVHTPEYVTRIRDGRLSDVEEQLLEVPFSPALRDAMWLMTGGTTLVARLALRHGVAVHLGGGFHHAFADHGEGFCLVNDVAIAIRMLQRDGAAARALVVDLDVHHGNGTAAIFKDDEAVFTFSMHQQQNYPQWKPPSDLDIGLPDGAGDDAYLDILEHRLPAILETHRPDVVFYLAGADPYRFDQLGGLALTLDGLKRRDAFVMAAAAKAHAPLVVVLAGGYARRTDDTVEIHCNTVRVARTSSDATPSAS
jgi:acetoin utilization deacetylase AcuC-like enzyme